MTVACSQLLPLYRPRDPQASDLWHLMNRHFDAFQRVYDERFQAKYGFWRSIIERSVTAFLRCGDLHEGFARVRCGDCGQEMFVAFSCKQRCTCPSCHQKRTLLTAIHVAEEVCSPVAHRQVVLTIPKRLRLHTRFDRKLLGKLCSCAWTCIQAEVRRLLGREDVLPGMVAAIQTHGELLHWHPHIHSRVTCGAFTTEGEFLKVPEFDMERLHVACSPTWAMLIKRVYEVDPLACPKCGGQMKVIAFIEPPQGAVIEKILRHCGLWHPSSPRPPPDDDLVYAPDGKWDGQTAFSDAPRELSYVPEMDWESQTPVSDAPWEVTYADADTFEATF